MSLYDEGAATTAVENEVYRRCRIKNVVWKSTQVSDGDIYAKASRNNLPTWTMPECIVSLGQPDQFP